MDIGKTDEEITVQPIVEPSRPSNPVPKESPKPSPKTPEKVPA